MKTIQEFLKESKIESEEDMMKFIDDSFKKEFPNGWIFIRKGAGISNDTITINLGIISNSKDQSHGIVDNDPMLHTFLIFNKKGVYSAESGRSGISINPKEKYFAMSTVKTKWRKVTGDVSKIAKGYERFFKKLKGLMKEHQQDIYGRDRYPDKYFKGL